MSEPPAESDDGHESTPESDEPGLLAGECPAGHLTYPTHRRCPECGREQTDTVDLSGHTAEVLTWTTAHAPPPGVRTPNRLAIVTFEVDGRTVRALGGTTESVAVGDTVRPVYVPELRDPEAGIRHPDAQAWDGYRFEPV
jgi:hypothetical protein